MLKCPLLLAILALLPVHPAAAWGVTGHRMLAAASLKDLPPALAAWFAGQEATLPAHANDPDHWKAQDPLEGPRHYLDSEGYGGAPQVPLDEAIARQQLGARFQPSGQVPWTIQERVRGLAQAFTQGDPAAVALAATYLSHYVGDIHVPLHTTTNYDGQETNQHGVHARWESGLLERIVAREGWAPEARPATLGEAPSNAPWVWLQESFALVQGVLSDDLAASANGRGEAYWQAFLPLQEGNVKERLALSAQRTAQMITLAWSNAGSPQAPPAAAHSR